MGVYSIFSIIARWIVPSITLIFVVLCISLILYKFVYKKILRGKKEILLYQFILFVILIGYLFLVFVMTGLSRTGNFSNTTVNLNFLSSYLDVWYSWSLTPLLLLILNILMLAPLGFLLPLISKKFNSAKNILLVAFIFTIFIEFFQLITHRGIFELDDLFHNTIGSMIGYFIVRVFIEFNDYKKISKTTLIKAFIIPGVYLVIFTGAIISYNLKEFGNLNINSFERTDISNVEIYSDIDFPSKDDRASVFYNLNSNNRKNAINIIKILNDNFDIPNLNKTGMDGDNKQYTFDTTSDSMYSMTYFYRDGTWSLYNNYYTDDMESIRLDSKYIDNMENILKNNKLIPSGAKFHYDENNYLRWDSNNTDIKNIKKDFIDGTIMITNSESGNLQSLDYFIKYNRYVRDVDIISPRDAFERIKKGYFYSYNPYNNGDKIQITDFEISYMYDSKGYYQPIYKFTGLVNGEKDTFSATIPALK